MGTNQPSPTATEDAPSQPGSPAPGSYARQKRVLAILDYLLTVGVVLAFLLTGASADLRDAAGHLSGSRPVALLVYAVAGLAGLALVDVPLDYYSGFVVERRFGLLRQRFGGWLGDWAKALGLELLLAVAAAELVYYLLLEFPHWWWVIAAAAFTAFFVVMANLAPVLLFPIFFKFEPLQDAELRDRITTITNRFGTRIRGVYLWRLGDKTSKSNAALMGWGPTRRVVIADTLLSSNTPEEIEVVVAHEVGHHVHRDIPKILVLQTLTTFAGFALINAVAAVLAQHLGFDSLSDFATAPLLLLIAAVFALALLPVTNTYSRFAEGQADQFALDAQRQPEAFISAMEKLAEQNKSDRTPNPVMEFIFYSHPSISRRVERARCWAASAQGRGSPK